MDDTPIHVALREALANCVINADYYGRQGLIIVKRKQEITFSNPGDFRIDIKDAISGGISDPRNVTLIKMFNLINIGERSGSGIPMIYSVWEKQGWTAPQINESFNPDRTSLHLVLSTPKKASIKSVDKKMSTISDKQRQTVISYLKDQDSISTSELAAILNLKDTRAREILRKMAEDGILTAEGDNRNRIYRMNSKS